MNRVPSSNAFSHPRLLYYASDEVRAWATVMLRSNFPEPCFALGVLNGKGKLVGAVIYNDYGNRNIEMSIYGPRGAFFRGVAREIFRYAFDELNCRRISVTIPEKHGAMIEGALRWGWKIEGRKRHFYDDDNAVIMGMLRDECRFL